ncbi:hypothetical protein HK105_202244 [Polyrhizophydium stewartii]|uniref:Pentatricopeptide repeat-containing protein n=1 Tax=Polyrhizophydium stewartii TaxID=2732419 RepID=A0ABR4NFL5_9FUNG
MPVTPPATPLPPLLPPPPLSATERRQLRPTVLRLLAARVPPATLSLSRLVVALVTIPSLVAGPASAPAGDSAPPKANAADGSASPVPSAKDAAENPPSSADRGQHMSAAGAAACALASRAVLSTSRLRRDLGVLALCAMLLPRLISFQRSSGARTSEQANTAPSPSSAHGDPPGAPVVPSWLMGRLGGQYRPARSSMRQHVRPYSTAQRRRQGSTKIFLVPSSLSIQPHLLTPPATSPASARREKQAAPLDNAQFVSSLFKSIALNPNAIDLSVLHAAGSFIRKAAKDPRVALLWPTICDEFFSILTTNNVEHLTIVRVMCKLASIVPTSEHPAVTLEPRETPGGIQQNLMYIGDTNFEHRVVPVMPPDFHHQFIGLLLDRPNPPLRVVMMALRSMTLDHSIPLTQDLVDKTRRVIAVHSARTPSVSPAFLLRSLGIDTAELSQIGIAQPKQGGRSASAGAAALAASARGSYSDTASFHGVFERLFQDLESESLDDAMRLRPFSSQNAGSLLVYGFLQCDDLESAVRLLVRQLTDPTTQPPTQWMIDIVLRLLWAQAHVDVAVQLMRVALTKTPAVIARHPVVTEKMLKEENLSIAVAALRTVRFRPQKIVQLLDAQSIPERRIPPGPATIGITITGLALNHRFAEAYDVIEDAQRNFGIAPHPAYFNGILFGALFSPIPNVNVASDCLDRMVHLGITPGIETFTMLLNSAIRGHQSDIASSIISLVFSSDVVPDEPFIVAVISWYLASGELGMVRDILARYAPELCGDTMPGRADAQGSPPTPPPTPPLAPCDGGAARSRQHRIAWTSRLLEVLVAYQDRSGPHPAILGVVDALTRSDASSRGVMPSCDALMMMVRMYANACRFDSAESCIQVMRKSGFEPNMHTAASLACSYLRSCVSLNATTTETAKRLARAHYWIRQLVGADRQVDDAGLGSAVSAILDVPGVADNAAAVLPGPDLRSQSHWKLVVRMLKDLTKLSAAHPEFVRDAAVTVVSSGAAVSHQQIRQLISSLVDQGHTDYATEIVKQADPTLVRGLEATL